MANTAKMITRSNADTLIPTEVSNEILKSVPTSSKLLPLMRRLPNLSSKQRTIPIMNVLPSAYFLNGDTAQKKTTNAEWDKLTLTAEELAVIVPIPEAVLDDANYDIWGEIKPYIAEAFASKIDKAILFGDNKPDSWPSAIVPTAISKGFAIQRGTNVDLASDIIGENGLMSKVENVGYRVSGFLADSSFEASLRDLRDANRGLLYSTSMTAGTPNTLVGRTITYDNGDVFNPAQALMVGGDFTKAVYAIRQDLTYKVLTEAVIQNDDGSIAFNLAQQDMVALRCVMRIGVQIANPVNIRQTDANKRYPFAVLQPEASTPAADESQAS